MEKQQMHWEFVIALIIAVPVVLFPGVLIWHMNLQGLCSGLKRGSRQNKRERNKRDAKIRNLDLITVNEEYYDA
jgi:hypothetical protein